MKRKGIIILLFIGYFTTNIYSQLTNGLKAYYAFGGNTNDLSGQGHNGTLVGTPLLTTDRFNTTNCAYQFPGDTACYIKINYGTDFNITPNGALSISLWYQGGTASAMDLETLFGKVNTAISPSNDYYLGLYDMNNPAFGNMYSVAMPFSTPPIPDPNWHHLVGVYDDRKWYIYEDNSLVASNVTQSYIITQSNGYITVGKGFGGKIDDIRFYNRALSASEISQIYALPGSCAAVGIKELSEQLNVSVFPNPTTGAFYLDLDYTGLISMISVFDITGKQLMSKQVNETSSKIDLTQYSAGIYYVKITNSEFEKKLLIVKEN